MLKNSANRTKNRIVHKRSVIWILIAMIVLMMSWWLPVSFVERFYYHGFFRLIRVAYDTIFGWLPIPMIYLVIVFVVVRLIIWGREMNKGFVYQASRITGGIAAIVALFYIVWAFNYRQIPLQERLGYDLNQVTYEDLENEFYRATEDLKNQAAALPDQYTTEDAIASWKVTDDDLRTEVEKSLADLTLPHSGHVRVRQLWPNGFLLRWSTAGIYIPHAFEGHIDKGLLSVQKPFTMAHEMAHGYGVTDEGACNFIAWLACNQSQDQWIRYSGALTYWRYAAAEIPDEKVKNAMNTFDPVIRRSLLLIRENDKKYPDLMPQVRDAIYSSYLKKHGVKGGLRSYNYVVMMVVEHLRGK